MKEEKIVKGYDPVIMRRLLSFVKPYKLPAAIAICALAVATVAELATPVLMQRTIDQYIMSRYFRFADTEEVWDILEEAGIAEGAIEAGGNLYLPETEGEKVPADTKNELIENELFSRESRYLAAYKDTQELNRILEAYPDRLQRVDGYIIGKHSFVSSLPREQRVSLRSGDIEGVGRMSVIYFILLVITLLFMFAQVYLMAYTGQGVMRDIRTRLFTHTTRQSINFLGTTPVGTLVTRITNDVETINEFFTSVATSILRDFALMGGVVVTLFILDTRLATITTLSLPPVLLLTLYFRTKARDAYRRVRIGVSRVNAFLSEHISGMDVVQMFARERVSRTRFMDRNNELLGANLSEMMVFAVFRPLINLFTSISVGVILYFGGKMVLETTISLGITIAYVNLIQKFYRPVMDFTEKFTILQSAMAGGERIFSLLDDVERIEDRGTSSFPSRVEGKIEFDNVSFSYKADEPVLKKLSFSIEPGETVAIVGYTGAGKTTIANLLARMWDIQEGSIRIDGVDLRDVPVAELRRIVQPVQQDVFLFADTVEENIRLGTDIPDETIRQAARTVRAEGFIEKLPEGYNTVLHEGGSNLSTGQRQLIAFSRAIAHDPRVLILDEATGSIDTETEALIQDAIDRLTEKRTSIVIAHRLSTIREADRILVLSEGRLVEQGTHEDLLKSGGLYATLYSLQYKGK
ncbi:MAG: ABC transporter ATP-binding protein [Spirochaetaceae bacterium]